jgi:hypothetical protein
LRKTLQASLDSSCDTRQDDRWHYLVEEKISLARQVLPVSSFDKDLLAILPDAVPLSSSCCLA